MIYRDLRKIYFGLSALFILIIFGVIGFEFLEQYSFIEAFYMTIISISTVGFGEIRPLSDMGRLFTVFLIVFSFGIFAYVLTAVTQFLLDGAFREYLKYRKVNKKIIKLNNHTIVCGFGRNGKQAAIELISHDEAVLVIEKDKGLFDDEINENLIKHPLFSYIIGDSTQDEIMEKARTKHAKALITTLPDDANNLFVVLTARELNPKLTIVARASDDHSDVKLKRAGANNVIMPDKVGGSRMAKLVVEPDIVEFLESLLLRSGSNHVNMVEMDCKSLKPYYINKTIQDLHVRSKSGANLIGIKKDDNIYDFNPAPDTILDPRYKIFALGSQEQIQRLKNLLMSDDEDFTYSPD